MIATIVVERINRGEDYDVVARRFRSQRAAHGYLREIARNAANKGIRVWYPQPEEASDGYLRLALYGEGMGPRDCDGYRVSDLATFSAHRAAAYAHAESAGGWGPPPDDVPILEGRSPLPVGATVTLV